MSTIKNNPYKIFSIAASVCSIVGFILIFTKEKDHIILASVTFIVFLLTILIFIYVFGIRFIKKENKEPVKKNCHISIYKTNDGNKIEFDIYKVIQLKRPVMYEYMHDFKWTGSKPPKIESDLQEIGDIMNSVDSNKMDKVALKFKNPLFFNETSVIHARFIMDDQDRKSEPFVQIQVNECIELIIMKAVLKHRKSTRKKNMATIKRQRIDSETTSSFECIEDISFDKTTKTFTYKIPNPEVGYIYRMEWEK